MYNLKFFSRAPVEGVIPSYRAMACTSYEISPPMSQLTTYDQFADVVMHLPDGKCVTWPLKGNDVLFVENAGGTTIDKIRNPDPQPENVSYGNQSMAACDPPNVQSHHRPLSFNYSSEF